MSTRHDLLLTVEINTWNDINEESVKPALLKLLDFESYEKFVDDKFVRGIYPRSRFNSTTKGVTEVVAYLTEEVGIENFKFHFLSEEYGNYDYIGEYDDGYYPSHDLIQEY